MLGYYLQLGFRNLRRSPVLTALIILTLAVGVAASMSTLTVLYMMSGDPIPQKSSRLLTLKLDNYPLDFNDTDEKLPGILTWTDVRNLREDAKGLRRTGLYGISGIVYPNKEGVKNFFADGVAVDADFFAMMDAPFIAGGAWTAAEDRSEARVAVIAAPLAEKLFGKESAIGRNLRMDSEEFRVVGVLHDWKPTPKFYRMDGNSSAGSDADDIFIPLSTALAAHRDVSGNTSCYSNADPGFEGLMRSECIWLRYWVELGSEAERAEYRDYLSAYVQRQKQLGRLPRPDKSALYNVREWLQEIEVVDDDTRLQTWLAFGFLSVCLVNTIGLLLAKFTARTAEIGVRRALGATRSQIFLQYLSEAAALGLVGSIIGVAGAFGMLHLLAKQSPNLEQYARMDPTMLATTVLLSVLAAVIAGLLPTLRATQVVPALQLKSQ
ncbi:FtsX-like permease family protein [Stagnimonas aquatica]|uniref:FtsX-like permease family protein n=1 Tax=Stagnimonas aquatica TaxID=2689987 RepID=A0A3N0VH32_9GAMM|nr:ABC transporter permease [Stagnimonas aquatica]ROH92063.1 FtsX-like permease family protein [Stagnimonas aquatica]